MKRMKAVKVVNVDFLQRPQFKHPGLLLKQINQIRLSKLLSRALPFEHVHCEMQERTPIFKTPTAPVRSTPIILSSREHPCVARVAPIPYTPIESPSLTFKGFIDDDIALGTIKLIAFRQMLQGLIAPDSFY